jgi:hypothetical protein
MFKPSRMGYFDLASDPLSQAAERASLCLFLRGDLESAPDSVALVMTEADLQEPPAKIPTLAPRWHWLAWVTRVGTEVVSSPQERLAHSVVLPLAWHHAASDYRSANVLDLNPYSVDDSALVKALETRKLFGADNAPRPQDKYFRGQRGEITIDGPRNQLVLDTRRTAGGFAPAGQTITTTAGGVTISMRGTDATAWVSALDELPIHQSRRLLVTHLTDLQNTGIKYAEAERKTLLDWGQLPYLVRAGKAEVSVKLDSPNDYKVWALSLGGKRVNVVPARVESGSLHFVADISADPAGGARILYEVARD